MTGRSTAWVRPQPIRDAILAYLTEPRLARDIALHIDRPVPTATGHLAAMRRRCRVKRIAYAVYAAPDWPAPAETMGPSAKSPLTRAAILAYLTEPRCVREIALHIDRSRETTGSHLTDMRRSGLIKRVGYGLYALPDLSAEALLTTPSHAVTPPASCQHFAPLPARHRNLEDLSLGTAPSEAEVKAALNDAWLHDDSGSAPVEPTRRLFLARRILSHALRSASG
jgi:hypothetical protein